MSSYSGGKELMSADMIREEQRLKWEAEEQEAVNGPVHYANVQHNGQPSFISHITRTADRNFITLNIFAQVYSSL